MWRRLRCCSTHSSCKAWPELKDEKVPTAWPETGNGKWAPTWCPCPRQRPFESLASLSWWSCNPGRTAQRHCRTSWQRRPWRSLRICLDRMKFNRDILMVWAWSLPVYQKIGSLAPRICPKIFQTISYLLEARMFISKSHLFSTAEVIHHKAHPRKLMPRVKLGSVGKRNRFWYVLYTSSARGGIMSSAFNVDQRSTLALESKWEQQGDQQQKVQKHGLRQKWCTAGMLEVRNMLFSRWQSSRPRPLSSNRYDCVLQHLVISPHAVTTILREDGCLIS